MKDIYLLHLANELWTSNGMLLIAKRLLRKLSCYSIKRNPNSIFLKYCKFVCGNNCVFAIKVTTLATGLMSIILYARNVNQFEWKACIYSYPWNHSVPPQPLYVSLLFQINAILFCFIIYICTALVNAIIYLERLQCTKSAQIHIYIWWPIRLYMYIWRPRGNWLVVWCCENQVIQKCVAQTKSSFPT